MMSVHVLRGEERTGLLVALGLHVALVAVLLLQPVTRELIPQPQRMTVSLAEDVGMEATAPDPVAESRASIAPELSETPAAPPEDATEPAPREIEQPVPRVQSPVPVPTVKPKPSPPRERAEQPRKQTQPKSSEKAGGSRLGDNFLEGAGDSTKTSETRVPASKIGSSAKASLVQAIARRIKPRWEPPNGPDVEKITTYLRFRLNEDGSLSGRPEVVRQTGINDTNRAQASRHAEQAVRAVQLAAPFDDLPAEYYEAWKLVTFSFDWRLAQ